MIEQVCAHIHNYFEIDPVTGQTMLYQGTYTIENGTLVLPFLTNGQYFRVFGSKLNDGVYLYPSVDMIDETFTGVIWEMRPPRTFLKLVDEIQAWMDKYGDVMKNPYQSEDVIGVYRYTKMTQGKVTGEFIATWQNVFKDQLNEWRRLS